LVTSTLLTLLVLPTVYHWMEKGKAILLPETKGFYPSHESLQQHRRHWGFKN
jgi:hypothetical protein